MYCGDEVSAIVGDVGHYESKIGFAGEDMPKFVCPSTIGHTLSSTSLTKKKKGSFYVGTNALFADKKDHSFSVSPPRAQTEAHSGSLTDWEVMEQLWSFAYDQLSLQSNEHPVLVTDSCFSSDASKESYAELMFETFEAPCMYLAYDAVLSAFSHGKTDAVVVDCGSSATRVVPIHQGYVLHGAAQRASQLGGDVLTNAVESLKSNIAGANLLSHYALTMARRLKLECFKLPAPTEHYMRMRDVNDLKAAVCCLSPGPFTQGMAVPSASYTLPDGTTLTYTSERFQIAELMFNPAPSVSDAPSVSPSGLHHVVFDSIQACDVDLRTELLTNLLLCGGGSCLENLNTRLTYEMSRLVPSIFKVRTVTATALEKRFSVFTGGSILASLGTFQQMWISREEYDEVGSSLINSRCF